MRRTEKSKANSRQKSKANSRQKKSIANGRQSKPKNYDRDKAKYEEKHSTDESCSQRCRCPASARRSDHDYPNHRLQRGNRGVKENHPDSSEATQKVQKTVKVPQIRDCEQSDGFFQLESRGPTKSGQQAAATSRRCVTATKEDLEQNTADIPAVVQRQELVIQKAPRTVDIPLLQCADTTDVPVAK